MGAVLGLLLGVGLPDDRIHAANTEIGDQVHADPSLDGMGTTLIAPGWPACMLQMLLWPLKMQGMFTRAGRKA